MEFTYSPYLIITLLSAAICLVLSVYAYMRHGRAPEAAPLILLLLAMTCQLAAYGLGLTSPDEQTKLFWIKMEYIGISAVPLFLLIYAIYRAGYKEWLNARRLVLLAIIPVTTLLLMWTNEWHGLIWSDYRIFHEGSLMLEEKTYGAWFWLYAAYCYVLMVAVIILMIRSTMVSVSVYRRQNILIIIAVIVPWIGNAIYIFGTDTFGYLDPTPFSFIIAGLVMTYTLFNLRLLDVIPIAREVSIEVMSEAVIVLDKRNIIVDANPSVRRMLGMDISKIVGRHVNTILKDFSDKDQMADIFGRVSLEIVHDSGDETKYYDVRVTILKDKRDNVSGRMLVFHNITERKRNEAQLKQHYESERELRQQLEEEIERRANFVRALVHELKTPLTPMMASSQLLLEELKEQRIQALAKNINESTHVMNKRIDELLDMAKGEVGIFKLNYKPIHLVRLLNSIADEMAPLGSNHNQSLVVELPDSLPQIRADENRLRQVVQNLLSNAFKFASKADSRIILRARQRDSDILVEVTDNGPGISPEDQEHLFDVYFRKESDGPQIDGLGLGLSLCKTIVELHGGEIWVKSNVGEGSTFYFTLPLLSA